MLRKLMNSYAKKVALPPGTLVHLGERSAPRIEFSLMVYNAETFEEYKPHSLEEAFLRMRPQTVAWLNITGLHDIRVFETLGSKFNIHALTLEDILNTGQRPKAELFDEYVYFVLKMIRYDEPRKELDLEQISLLLGPDFVITVQERPGDVLDSLRERIRRGKGHIRSQGSDYLLYGLLDIIVDHYFLSLESISEDIEELENRTLDRPEPSLSTDLHRIKRELMFLRKATWPLREQITVLLREEHPLIHTSIRPYLRDLYDHTIQVIDTVDTFRDTLAGVLDVYLSSLSMRLNDVMRILTIISTVFIPLTFIAGIYGMNFDFMPELRQPWGYPLVLGVCIGIAVAMVTFFRRKGWL